MPIVLFYTRNAFKYHDDGAPLGAHIDGFK
jgi:hypothetical protein